MPIPIEGPIKASADYLYVDAALKTLWQPFQDLVVEMESFVPRPLSDYETERREQLDHFRRLNPHHSEETIAKWVDGQISFAATEGVQFSDCFSNRFMNQYVMVAFLSHALCEAAINAILAIGLVQTGAQGLFSILEKADIKEKWRVGPKAIFPNYELKPGTAIFETLDHLTKRRNALVHNKIHLHIGDKKVLEGSKFESLSFQENTRWMLRFFSLPYDLVAQVDSQLGNSAGHVLIDRSPIVKAEVH